MRHFGYFMKKMLRHWLFQVCAGGLLAVALVLPLILGEPKIKEAPVPAEANLALITIGTAEITAAELNYYFRDCYESFCSTYRDALAENNVIDLQVPLNQQLSSETETWADYFYRYGVQNSVNTALIYEAAEQADFSKTDSAVEEQLEELRRNSRKEYKTLTAFLQSVYGPLASEESYREYLTRRSLAEGYSKEIYDTVQGTEKEKQKAWDQWFLSLSDRNAETVVAEPMDYLYMTP